MLIAAWTIIKTFPFYNIVIPELVNAIIDPPAVL